ncbi:MAG: hypothetical protein H8E68_09315 [Kiritimatiellaeota bacterium]|nr:hypothetical protein [Kiritimatiellota bacterium]
MEWYLCGSKQHQHHKIANQRSQRIGHSVPKRCFETFGTKIMTKDFSYEPFDNLVASLREDDLIKQADILHHRLHVVAWTTRSELIQELAERLKIIQKQEYNRLSEASKSHFLTAVTMIKRVIPDFDEDE